MATTNNPKRKPRKIRKPMGRPKVSAEMERKQAHIRLPNWMLEELDEMDGARSELIEQAVMQHFGLISPDSTEDYDPSVNLNPFSHPNLKPKEE